MVWGFLAVLFASALGFRVSGFGFQDEVSGCGIRGLGFRVWGFKVQGFGFGYWLEGLVLKFWGLRFGVWG